MTAKHAIDISVNEDRTVYLTYNESLLEDLLVECEDSNRPTPTTLEAWGTSDSGSIWRIVLEDCPR